MNIAIIRGNITKDIELRSFQNGTYVTNFYVAVKRDFKNANGEYESDFISCKAIGNTAEMISKYFHKGSGIIIEGHIQTGSFEGQDGKRVYTTDVIVNRVHFDRNNSVKQEDKKEEIKKEEQIPDRDPFEEFGKKIYKDTSEKLPWE